MIDVSKVKHVSNSMFLVWIIISSKYSSCNARVACCEQDSKHRGVIKGQVKRSKDNTDGTESETSAKAYIVKTYEENRKATLIHCDPNIDINC